MVRFGRYPLCQTAKLKLPSAGIKDFVDLCVTVGALVFGWLLSTDAFSPLFITRVWRIASLLATTMGLRTDLTELIEQKVKVKFFGVRVLRCTFEFLVCGCSVIIF